MATLNRGIGRTSSLPRLVQHPWSCARVHKVVTALERRKSYTRQVVGIRVWYFSYFSFSHSLSISLSLCLSCRFGAHLLPHNRRGSTLCLSPMCLYLTVSVLVFVFVFFFGLVFITAIVFLSLRFTCCLMTRVQNSVFESHVSVCSPQRPHVCCSKNTNCEGVDIRQVGSFKQTAFETTMAMTVNPRETFAHNDKKRVVSPILCTCSRWAPDQCVEEQVGQGRQGHYWRDGRLDPTCCFLDFFSWVKESVLGFFSFLPAIWSFSRQLSIDNLQILTLSSPLKICTDWEGLCSISDSLHVVI